MTKDEKSAYLRNGGILIRRGKDREGQPIIKQRTNKMDWHELRKFDSVEIRDKTFDALTKHHSSQFKSDE